MSDILKHYGTPRHSGRYPWGSGDDPEQRNKSFLGYVENLKKQGMSEVKIAEGVGMTTSQLRARKSIAKAEQRKADVAEAIRLNAKGYSNVVGGKIMGINESSFRSLLNPTIQTRSEITDTTANMLKENIDKKGYIDIGVGVERHIGVSRTRLKTSIEMLKEEGYLISYIPVEQLGTGKSTTIMVLSKPKNADTTEIIKLRNKGYSDIDISKKMGVDETTITSLVKEAYSDVYKNKDKIGSINEHSNDGGRSFLGLEPIQSVNSNRVKIRYSEEGGSDKDGVIELRRGVEDISLGKSKYAQVRIGIDDTHYLKGMAMYSDDMPDGIDIIYNTNKKGGTPKEKVFKEMQRTPDGEIDKDNPFGATIKAGGQRKALNIVNEEGDWQEKWSKSLSSQMLSKQTPNLAKKQLDLTYFSKREEYDEIMSLTNPVVKKRLLESFADDCDSSSVHLKAAALPREGWHVILPVPSMKETEIYAPNYRNGEKVVLIRYPHGGTFEIPELTVNNRHASSKAIIGEQAKDAVGIHPKVAERLSGADFDGDTVLVIPNSNRLIKTQSPLNGLKNFDPKVSYAPYHGMATIDGGVWDEKTGKVDYQGRHPVTKTKQMKMGDVSNLITDMTIRGANPDEVARAVRHSMVVIDAEKHKLNYKQSYIDNGIGALKKKYQGRENAGASTLVSRASSDKRVLYREKGKKVLNPETGLSKRVYIDPRTGKKLYEYTGETYTDKNGKVHNRTIKSTKMAETDDAYSLSSGTLMEATYASHANKLKALANEARKQYLAQPPIYMSKSAKETYASEVASLNAHLNIALKNAPLERQAQLLANSIVASKRNNNPGMDADDLKKIKGQALAEARSRTGASKQRIDISDREWEAIQAGAISTNVLTQILNNTDIDKVKRLATPKAKFELSSIKKQKIKLMLATGYTQAEIADNLGISTTTVTQLLK